MRTKPENRVAAHPSGARAEPSRRSSLAACPRLEPGSSFSIGAKLRLTAACMMPRSGGDCSARRVNMRAHRRFVGDIPFQRNDARAQPLDRAHFVGCRIRMSSQKGEMPRPVLGHPMRQVKPNSAEPSCDEIGGVRPKLDWLFLRSQRPERARAANLAPSRQAVWSSRSVSSSAVARTSARA